MKIRKEFIGELVFAFMFSFMSIVLYYEFYDIDNNSYFIAICAAIVRTLVLVIVLQHIEKVCDDNVYTGGAFLLYSTVIYNQISVIKYSVDKFYPGAIDSLGGRIAGSLFIDFVIIICTMLFGRYHFYKQKKERVIKNNNVFSIPLFITMILVILYVIINVMYTHTTGIMLNNGVSRTMRTFVNAFTYIAYTVAILNVHKKRNNKIAITSTIPILLIGVANLYMTMISGKKNIIIIFAVVVVCGLLFNGVINIRIAKLAAYVSPMALQIVQILSEAISDRNFYSRNNLLTYHAFRFDISDFAITIATKFDAYENPLGIIWEAIEFSIPSRIYPNKITEVTKYKDQIEAVGLIRNFDFNDTFFSMGAQVGGFLGILLVFLSILLFFEWLSWKIFTVKKIYSGMFLVILTYFASCESDWSMFVFQTRDIVIYLLLAYVTFIVISKTKLRRK